MKRLVVASEIDKMSNRFELIVNKMTSIRKNNTIIKKSTQEYQELELLKTEMKKTLKRMGQLKSWNISIGRVVITKR